MANLTQLWSDRAAVTALEYGLIAALVIAVGLAGFSAFGTQLNTTFTTIGTMLGS